ncbi:MAG: SET domain-containing protein-lysine N-methyltransferase [Patescibacteria group bacterium]|nr:SET domain-containing protein-lysine N-methyltransferase [Patescibacteria group bacterium]MDE1965927.1 SET domain-containing protein-lysine N-methyltransferase [Patescibacteria group bacterium]
MNDLHARWSHRWLSPKAEARKSAIHGTGVFAVESIKQGETVGVLGGVVVPVSDIREYWKIMGHVGIQIDDGFFIVPTTRDELESKGVFNHSCDPNIGYSNSITFVAMRDIGAGEELVFDYAFNETYHNPMECHCGTAHCRKMFTGNDWKLKELQDRYGAYFSPYLRSKIGKA